MRCLVIGLLVVGGVSCGEPACPIAGLPPCEDAALLEVTDPFPILDQYEGEGMVTEVTGSSMTVQLLEQAVTLPTPAAIDLVVGDTVVLENPRNSLGVEIYKAGRIVGYVGRLADHRGRSDWVETIGPLEVELEPVCIRDTGSRSWCELGDEATYIVYAARIGGVVVPPGETRTGTIGGATATVRNRGINAQLDCEQTCTPIRQGQFGLDIAVQP